MNLNSLNQRLLHKFKLKFPKFSIQYEMQRNCNVSVKNVTKGSERFSKIPKGFERFLKVLKGSEMFQKVLKGFERF